MSHVALPAHYQGVTALPSTAAPARPRGGLVRRFIRWMTLSRQRQAQRDIDHLVNWRDGGFNDRFEQEIAERFYSDGWNFRR